MKTFLVVLAICTSPIEGVQSCKITDDQASITTYERFVDCVRDREWYRHELGAVAECTGSAWVPPHIVKG